MANKEFQVRHGLIVDPTANVLVANTITGNVGIGKSIAGYKLDVAGSVNASNILVSNFIDITPKASGDFKEGRLYYSSEEKTFVGFGDYSDFEQTLGEREWIRCKNSNAYTIYKGQAVYVTGVHISGHPIHGHHPTIALADTSDVNKKDVIGLAGHDIPAGEHGYIVVRGYIEGINTAGLTSGTKVHLGYNGGIVNDAPEYPNWPMDLGICLTSNTTNGTMYVDLSDHSMERLRVQNSARIGGDLTVEGDFTVIGSENKIAVNSLQVGTQFVYLNSGDSISNSNTYFTGTGLNDLQFKGHYNGSTTTTYYVKITGTGTTDKFSWSYLSDFSVLQASNVDILYQTSQPLANGISVYFNANTGHTYNDKWNATAYGVTTDFGFIGNHIDGPNGYTHAGLFRDASDGLFKFFHSYDTEPEGNIDIANTTFALANVQLQRLTADRVTGTEIYEGANRLSTITQNSVTGANNWTNTVFGYANAKFLANGTGSTANNYAYTGNLYFTSGNVTIGRTSDSDVGLAVKLDVNGAINASNFFINGSVISLGGGSASINVGSNEPTGNSNGSLWWNTDTGRLLIFYTDTDSSQWVDVMPIGEPGPIGAAGNVTIGTITTLAPNSSPTVTNSGNGSHAILNFGLPRTNSVTVGTTTTLTPGVSATVTNAGTPSDILLNFGVPRGNTIRLGTLTILSPNTPPTITNSGNSSDIVVDFGIPRPNSVTLGTTTTITPGASATVTNGGTAADILLNFGIPRGNTVRLGTTTTTAPNTPVSVTNSGNSSDIILDFAIPRNNTVSIGTVTTITPGAAATVTNGGTASDVVLNFGIPRGNTVRLGTTTTTAPNTPVSVTNSGNSSDIILDFAIPRNNTVRLGTVSILTPNTTPTITNSGTASDVILDFGIPRPNSVTVGTTTTLSPGSSASVTNGGTPADILLNFSIPRAQTVTLGTTTTLAPNTPPTVTNGGTAADVILNFSIPRNNTVTVGTTTTTAPGSLATVTNSGTASDLTLNFTVPRGNVGPYSPKSLTVALPQAGDEFTIFYTGPQSLTVSNVVGITLAQTPSWANSSVRSNVYYGTDRTSVATPIYTMWVSGNTVTANSLTTYTNATIPANNFVWCRVDSIVNTPLEFHISMFFGGA